MADISVCKPARYLAQGREASLTTADTEWIDHGPADRPRGPQGGSGTMGRPGGVCKECQQLGLQKGGL